MLWQDVEIESKLTSSAVAAAAPCAPSPAPTSAFKVSFMSNTASSVALTQVSATRLSSLSPSPNISNLCKWQHGPPAAQNDCFGFVEYQAWHHHMFKSKTKQAKPSNLSLLSLRDCVAGSGSSSAASAIFTRGLSTKERHNLATMLASSVLQLADTRWLSSETVWDLQEVYLIDMKQRALTAANAYVQRSFPQAPSNKQHKAMTPWIDNELVFALGVILIELAYGQSLETFKLPSDRDPQGNDYPHTDLQVALRLVRDLSSMEGKKYAEAAWRCVKCNFEARERSIDNAEFQDISIQESCCHCKN